MNTMNTTGRGLDNRVKGHLNQQKVLKALNRFGWLPMRQVHMACWSGEVTPRNAQRYLAQLLELKQITWKVGPDGSRVFALTSQGARRVRTELGLDATHDADFARRAMPSYFHRCLANDVGLWWSRLHGDTAGYYTEHEIVTGRAPISSAPRYMTDPLGKVPDALLTLERPVTADNPYAKWFAWVEVEFSVKPKQEHAHMVAALCDILAFGKQRWEINSDSVMRHAVVVCPRASHEYQLVEGVLQFLGANSANYDVKYIVQHLVIWRPGAEEGATLMEWIEEKPAFLTLRDKLRLWWPALPKE
jgi:hypothetical protein